MRAAIPGLENPSPLGTALPALYQQDDFAQRFLAGIDEVLAPILCALDNIDAYLDPRLAPRDFVRWLAQWVGMALDDNWPVERQRELVARASELYSWRGTIRGLSEHVTIYTGITPEVVDSGGCEWSPLPGAAPPGDQRPSVTVTLRVKSADGIDRDVLDAVVAAAKPAHVLHQVEVVSE